MKVTPGARFGRIVALAPVGYGRWSCACDCGARFEVGGDKLRGGQQQCGRCRTGDLNAERRARVAIAKRMRADWHTHAAIGRSLGVSPYSVRDYLRWPDASPPRATASSRVLVDAAGLAAVVAAAGGISSFATRVGVPRVTAARWTRTGTVGAAHAETLRSLAAELGVPSPV